MLKKGIREKQWVLKVKLGNRGKKNVFFNYWFPKIGHCAHLIFLICFADAICRLCSTLLAGCVIIGPWWYRLPFCTTFGSSFSALVLRKSPVILCSFGSVWTTSWIWSTCWILYSISERVTLKMGSYKYVHNVEKKYFFFKNFDIFFFFQTDSTKLRQHYMNSTTFYVDCLCLLPLDFLYLSLGFKSILRIFR